MEEINRLESKIFARLNYMYLNREFGTDRGTIRLAGVRDWIPDKVKNLDFSWIYTDLYDTSIEEVFGEFGGGDIFLKWCNYMFNGTFDIKIFSYHCEIDVRFKNGILNNVVRPSIIIFEDGYGYISVWFKDGKLHRSDGPAYFHNYHDVWFIEGTRLTDTQSQQILDDIEYQKVKNEAIWLCKRYFKEKYKNIKKWFKKRG